MNEEVGPEVESQSDSQTDGPGVLLRKARESIGVSVADVAETLNLPIKIVETIESEDYTQLPAPAFTRGYVRSYARLMELDADDLVRRYDDLVGVEEEQALVVLKTESSMMEAAQRHPGRVFGGSVAAALIAVVVVLWWVWPSEEAPGADEPVGVAAVESDASVAARREAATAPADALSAVDQASENQATETQATQSLAQAPIATEPPPRPDATRPDVADGDQVPDPEAASQSLAVQEVAEPAAGQSAVDEPESEAQTPAGRALLDGDQLAFTFSDDCWLEVRDGMGRLIYSDLSRSGSRLELAGEPPFKILLGYAHGVELEYNGDMVAIAPHTRNNVANFVLGQ